MNMENTPESACKKQKLEDNNNDDKDVYSFKTEKEETVILPKKVRLDSICDNSNKSESLQKIPGPINEINCQGAATNHTCDCASNSMTVAVREKKENRSLDAGNSQVNGLDSDSNYFRCYADLAIHRVMIGDYHRTHTYQRAILSNYRLFHRKVVLDVGAGTGILSVFCAQAGAKRVYAIEASAIADQAKEVVRLNNFSDRITVIQQKVEDAVLPEKVDVIVSEWMGYMLMYECMLPSLLFARDKWLKKGGCILPEGVKIYIAPISDHQEYDYNVEFWRRVETAYKVDMSTLAKTAEEQMQASVHVMSVDPASVQSHASCVTSLKLSTVDLSVTHCTEGSFSCCCFGNSIIHGFVIWFTVDFPNNIILSTSPYENETHWEQSVLYISPVQVDQNTVISGKLWIRRDEVYHRFLDIELEYKINNGEKKHMRYKMKD